MGSIDFLLHQAGWFKEFSVSFLTKTNLVELLTGKTNDWFVAPQLKRPWGTSLSFSRQSWLWTLPHHKA